MCIYIICVCVLCVCVCVCVFTGFACIHVCRNVNTVHVFVNGSIVNCCTDYIGMEIYKLKP